MVLDIDHDTTSTITTCHDDPDVEDTELLWRLVETVDDPGISGQSRRPKSCSLRNSQMSVDRAKISTPQDTLCLQPDRDIAQFTAKSVRELNLKVYADPCYVCRQCGTHLGNKCVPCPQCQSDTKVYYNKAHAIVCPEMKEGIARKFAKEKVVMLEIAQEIRDQARNLR